MKRTLVLVLSFALAFSVLSSWLAPKLLLWYFTPPVPAGASMAFNCADAVAWGMQHLIRAQLIGTGIGALFGLIVGVLVRRKQPPAQAPAAPPTATPAAPR